MWRRSQRAGSAVGAFLLVALLGGASLAASGSPCCCAEAGSSAEAVPHCQWLIPAACCDESLSVPGTNPISKPALTMGLAGPFLSSRILHSAPGQVGAQSTTHRISIILRL